MLLVEIVSLAGFYFRLCFEMILPTSRAFKGDDEQHVEFQVNVLKVNEKTFQLLFVGPI